MPIVALLQADRAKVLSNSIKQKRKEKAGKWDVPLPKVKTVLAGFRRINDPAQIKAVCKVLPFFALCSQTANLEGCLSICSAAFRSKTFVV